MSKPGNAPTESPPFATARSANKLPLALGGTAWLLAVLQFFVAQVLAAAAWHEPAYSWANNYISDLANTACGPFAVPFGAASYVCSPRHDLMNASFITTGLLTAVGALLLRSMWPSGGRTSVALALWIICGLGNVIIGLFPENVDASLHLTGALGVPIGSVAILLTGDAIIPQKRAIGYVGMLLGALGLLGTVLTIGGLLGNAVLYAGLGAGGMERIAVYPGFVWLLLCGLLAISRVLRFR